MEREQKKLILKGIIENYFDLIATIADQDGTPSGVKEGEEEQALNILNNL